MKTRRVSIWDFEDGVNHEEPVQLREPYTVIESSDDAVRGWAREIIETVKEDGEWLDRRAFETAS